MNIQFKRFTTIIVFLAIPLTGAGVDIYVPSLPAITHAFSASRESVQLSLTIYIFTYGLSQLLFGTLSDSIGRKKILIGGLIFFTFFSYLVTLSSDINLLLLMRACQGVCVAAIATTSRAIVNDLYLGVEYKKVMSYFTLAWALGPVLSPVIGGYLQHLYNWKAPFYFLVGYSAIVSVLSLFITETITRFHALRWKVILSNFSTILKHSQFWGWVIITSLLYALIVVFGIIAPFLIQTQLHYNAAVYGHVASLIGIAWISGIFLNRLFVQIDIYKLMPALLIISLMTSTGVLIFATFMPMTLYNFVLPILLIFLLAATMFPSAYGGSIGLFPEMSGTVSSVMGGLTAGVVSIISSFTVLLKAHNQIPMLMVFVAFMSVSMICYFGLIKRTRIKYDEY